MKEQVVELWSSTSIETNDFSIEHGLAVPGCGHCFPKCVERVEGVSDLTGAKDKCSAFYVKLDSPNNAEAVVHEVKDVPGMQRFVTRSMSEYLSMMTPDNIPLLSIFINVVIGISVVIGFLVIFQAMYAAVSERTTTVGM